MAIGTLRRYHRERVAGTIPDLPAGSTPTEEEAQAAAAANAQKLGREQEEQAQRADSEQFPPTPPESVQPVVAAKASTETGGEAPKRNASRDAWLGYVGGLPEADQPEGWQDMSRDELATAVLGAPAN